MNAIAITARTIELGNGLEVTINERGDAAASPRAGVLVLHSGAGPRSIAGLAAALSEHVYVITPTHPGFENTPRVGWLESVADLADAYLDLIEELKLESVMVIGNSIGGWIASEMALRDTDNRISALVLLGATGITPEPGQIADPATLGPVRTGELAFHNPELRLNPATLSEEQKAGMAANQRTQAVYTDIGHNPALSDRLTEVTIPVLVLAGEQDGIVPLAYERKLADAFPRATFQPIAEAGHFPHIEQPGAVFGAIGDFVDTQVKPNGE